MQVYLRKVEEADLELLLAWAHIPEIWKYLPTTRQKEKLLWWDHWRWWKHREDRIEYMITVNDGLTGRRRVGVVHYVIVDPFPEVGLYIGETTLWGEQVGKDALMMLLEKLAPPMYLKVRAVIHPKNKRSIRLFTGLGFHKIEKGRKGQDTYEFDFRSISRSEIAISFSQGGDRRSYQPSVT